jgi:molybdopterin converting factor subunit 1
VLFFGVLRETVGRAEDVLEVETGSTAGAVLAHYAALLPALRELDRSIAVAVNERFQPRSATLQEGDEVAFLPPVSGGAAPYTHALEQPYGFFALTREPLDAAALARLARRDEDGAVVTFEGTVRNNTAGRATEYLEYECYEAMAVKVMAAIGGELAAAGAIGRVVMAHRLGRMRVGETSVVVAVSAPHRKPAFEAALEGINRLKRRVPIWKKEHFTDGAVWVEGDWDRGAIEP